MTEVELLEKILSLLENIHTLIFFTVTVGFALLVVYITLKPLWWFLHEY